MIKFLTFENFITQDILIFFYYIGVFFLPVLLWIYKNKVVGLFNAINNKAKTISVLLFIFLMMQTMWRMMFEAMIGYFDMHNYLQILSECN